MCLESVRAALRRTFRHGGFWRKLFMNLRRLMKCTRHVSRLMEKEVHTKIWRDNVKENHMEDLGVGCDNIKMCLQEIVFTGRRFMEKWWPL
jgi:hypothetical protein